ncbi:MAG: hypothetical protein RBQ97_10610 [Acholeplasma sp.]|nr:hypothetical protein [Acholeplasma sp.]MDY0278521.1 hypothetical protein [Acholeplasma sp.]
MNRNKVEALDTILRYKKSINIDSFFTFVLTIILIILSGMLSEIIGVRIQSFYFPIIILALFQNIAQDFMFHRSIGKRIYRLKIVTKIDSKKKLFKALVMRKFYESTYIPLINKDFAAIVNMIEAMTETKIVDDIKNKTNKVRGNEIL